MGFMYCFDNETKDKLIKKGFKFLKETQVSGSKAYIFISNDKLNFNEIDRNKVLLSNKLNF